MLRTKTRMLRAGCAALLLSIPTTALFGASPLQDTKVVEEPQYVGQFHQIGTDGKLIPLESQQMTMESKTHNHFISVSTSGGWAVPSTSSPVRVPSSAHFVVRVSPGMENIDPSTLVTLKPFVVTKEKRTLPTSSAKAVIFGGVKSEGAADTSLPLTFKKYGTISLEITPATPLPPGEYALGGPSLGMSVFCFGVDAK